MFSKVIEGLKRWWNHSEYGTPAAEILGERPLLMLHPIPSPHEVKRGLDAYTDNVVIVLNMMSSILGNTEQVRRFTLSSGIIRLPACRYLTDEEVAQTRVAFVQAGWQVNDVQFVLGSNRHLYFLSAPPNSD